MGEESVMDSGSHPVRVDFVLRDETHLPGLLGMTLAPGMKALGQRGRWDRDLEADLRVLRQDYGTDTLVSVMEEHEYISYGIPKLFERDLLGDIEVLRFAIEDMNIPKETEVEEYEAHIRDIVNRMSQGKNVLVHFRGGLGRTGAVAGALLGARFGASEIPSRWLEGLKGSEELLALICA